MYRAEEALDVQSPPQEAHAAWGRGWLWAALSLAILGIFREPLRELVTFAWSSDLFFYIVLIPFVSAYFFYTRQRQIFAKVESAYVVGPLVMTAGGVLYGLGTAWGAQLTSSDYLGVVTAAVLVSCVGGFLWCYGLRALRQAAFPVGFLFLMVPLPSALLDQLILLLQRGSTEAVAGMLRLTTLPVTRQGFVFALSHLEFEVSKECSGIRAAVYLLLTSLVLGQVFLTSPLRRTVLTLAVVPLAIVKNGLRIVTLALLGNYVHEDILASALHRQGGIPFMVVGVLLLAVVVRMLQEKDKGDECP